MGTLNPAHSLTHSLSVADTEILRICVRKRTSPQSAHIRRGQVDTPTRTGEQGEHTETHTYRQTHRQTDTETGR